jgi:hypothetical protein
MCVVTPFLVPVQKKNTKKKIYRFEKTQKIITVEKRMPERSKNGEKLVEEVQKYKD